MELQRPGMSAAVPGTMPSGSSFQAQLSVLLSPRQAPFPGGLTESSQMLWLRHGYGGTAHVPRRFRKTGELMPIGWFWSQNHQETKTLTRSYMLTHQPTLRAHREVESDSPKP